MHASDYTINLFLSAMLIVGGYQFYFWCQRNPLAPPRELALTLDERIPYWPVWVWVYTGIYYPFMLFVNFLMDSPRQFTHLAVSYFLLLFAQMAFFLLFPVVTPAQWRSCNRRHTLSERVLMHLQRFDAPSNSFPSMHVSVATLTALHLQTHFGAAIFAFPLLVALSCLFTKQHCLMDLPPGAVLGWIAHQAYLWML